jgi:ribose transport system permease protein
MTPATLSVWTKLRPYTNPTALSFVGAGILFAITSISASGFASLHHLPIFLTESSFIGIVAIGQFFVIVAGGIDLSVPSTITASAIVLSLFVGHNDSAVWWAIPVVLLMAAGVGVANGVGVTILGGSPIVITLAMNVLVVGVLIAVTGGAKANSSTHTIIQLSDGRLAGIPGVVIVWAVLFSIGATVMGLTTFGRRLYALGSRRTVAVFSGVKPIPNTIATYVISAVLAAIAGIVLSGHTGQPYLGLGDPYLFSSVAAVAIGGASILGGSGNIAGSVAGALTLTVLQALFPILNLSPAALNVAYAVAILATVAFAVNRAGARR